MFNDSIKIFLEEAIERKKEAQMNSTISVNKNYVDKLRADIDYIAMMCDVELDESIQNEIVEEVITDEQISES